jgi:hypothetical protein
MKRKYHWRTDPALRSSPLPEDPKDLPSWWNCEFGKSLLRDSYLFAEIFRRHTKHRKKP